MTWYFRSLKLRVLSLSFFYFFLGSLGRYTFRQFGIRAWSFWNGLEQLFQRQCISWQCYLQYDENCVEIFRYNLFWKVIKSIAELTSFLLDFNVIFQVAFFPPSLLFPSVLIFIRNDRMVFHTRLYFAPGSIKKVPETKL